MFIPIHYTLVTYTASVLTLVYTIQIQHQRIAKWILVFNKHQVLFSYTVFKYYILEMSQHDVFLSILFLFQWHNYASYRNQFLQSACTDTIFACWSSTVSYPISCRYDKHTCIQDFMMETGINHCHPHAKMSSQVLSVQTLWLWTAEFISCPCLFNF